MYIASATLARLPRTNTIFWPRNVTPLPEFSNPLKVCDTENKVLKGLDGRISITILGNEAYANLNIIMKTIIMGKMEMVLPDIHMMNKFIGTCLKGPRARSQLLLILRLGSASLEDSSLLTALALAEYPGGERSSRP